MVCNLILNHRIPLDKWVIITIINHRIYRESGHYYKSSPILGDGCKFIQLCADLYIICQWFWYDRRCGCDVRVLSS